MNEELEDGFWWFRDRKYGRNVIILIRSGSANYPGTDWTDDVTDIEWQRRFEVLERVQEPR